MKGEIKKFLILVAFALVPTFLIWLPFFFRISPFWKIPLPQNGIATIVANYDGPLYLVIAKTFYNPELIKANFQFPLPIEYYASHFPLFPLLIKTFSFLTSVTNLAGFPYSMLLVTLASSILAIYFFYRLAKDYLDEKRALFLTFIFSIFPARWLVVRSVGTPEPLFLAALIASIYYFKNKKYLAAGIWGAIAQLVKPPGIILFFAFLLSTLISKNYKKAWPIVFIPLALIPVFILFGIQLKDFWAYFHSGDNIHLFFPPFQIFNYSAPWVGTFWLEEIIFVYLIGAVGIIKLWQKKESVLFYFTGLFFIISLFISHRDIVRYSLPMAPFLLIAFSETLVKKEFRIVLCLIAIPIYLFSLAFISQNVMPISNWAPFL